MKFAHVAFPIPEDLTFTYSIPNHFIPIAQIGCRVLASFGSSIREGVIVNLLDKPNVDNPDFKIKAITVLKTAFLLLLLSNSKSTLLMLSSGLHSSPAYLAE